LYVKAIQERVLPKHPKSHQDIISFSFQMNQAAARHKDHKDANATEL
jgi:hypothetical protein